MRTIEEITQLAVAAHSGQKDMIGNPAILHVLAVDLLTHRDGISYEKYVKNIVASGNRIAIHVKLNDLRHNLLRAEHSLGILQPSGSTQALYEEILRIAVKHDWAERYIREYR